MNPRHSKSPPRTFPQIANAVSRRLAKNARVRRTLPGGGRLRMDRQLPFLCLYREPPLAEDVAAHSQQSVTRQIRDRGTRELVTSEAAYLFASGEKQYHSGLNQLCRRISNTMREHFGTFLLIELWAQPRLRDSTAPLLQPAFELVTSEPESVPSLLSGFSDALGEITMGGYHAQVTVSQSKRVAPPGLPPLKLDGAEEGSAGCLTLGVAVRPIYLDARSGTLFPMVLQSLRSQLAWALRKAIANFHRGDAVEETAHYHTLGPSSLVKAARLVDQQLCEVSESFDFLLQVTPTNSDQAWQTFSENGFRIPPTLFYRPLPYHPSLLKRRLFDIEVERIEDPILAHLFWEKQSELDRQLTALRHLDSDQFLYCSLQHFGAAEDELVALANEILRTPCSVPCSDEDEPVGNGRVELAEVVRRAREEIDYYHQQMSEFHAAVDVRDDIASGIMVSRGSLLISESLQLAAHRLEPLLHHEIGTHLLTYFNGRCQPFRQLYAGLAGYEELQEGLAVIAEYLTGGLTQARLRALAGRVIAVRSMTDGASFVDTFSRLRDGHGFSARQAFVTTLRVYRGGGLTKDIIYLRGLRDLLAYLAGGHEIEPLYVGKIGLQHLPYVQEMRRRGIINAPGVLPRFWSDPQSRARLDACRERTVVELLESEG